MICLADLVHLVDVHFDPHEVLISSACAISHRDKQAYFHFAAFFSPIQKDGCVYILTQAKHKLQTIESLQAAPSHNE